jgi:hypothetical protein
LRVLGGVDLGGVFEFCDLFMFLSFYWLLFTILVWFAVFVPLLVLWHFLLLDDLLKIFLGFWPSSCASWGLGFKLQTLCFLLSMDSSMSRLRNQVVNFLVCTSNQACYSCRLHHKTDGWMLRRGACVEIWRLALLGSKSR